MNLADFAVVFRLSMSAVVSAVNLFLAIASSSLWASTFVYSMLSVMQAVMPETLVWSLFYSYTTVDDDNPYETLFRWQWQVNEVGLSASAT